MAERRERRESIGDEAWNEVCHDIDDSLTGEGASSDSEGGDTGRCPGKEAVRWQNRDVYIQIRESGRPIFGTLSIRANDDLSNAFIVWVPTGDPTQATSKYGFHTPISHVHSMRLVRPSLGTPQVILTLRSGCSHAPLNLCSGRAKEFQNKLAEVSTLSRSEMNPATLLINDNSDMLQRSLHGLDLAPHSPARHATRSRAPTLPSSPQRVHDTAASAPPPPPAAFPNAAGEQECGSEPGSEWQWRYLQGGVCVMKSLRTGWTRASALAVDAAASAAELLENGGVALDSSARESSGARTCAARRSGQGADAKGHRVVGGRGHGAAEADEDCVWVEREPLPWQSSRVLDEGEWRSMFNASGVLKDLQTLRSRAYYGGLSPAVRREGWKWLLGCFPARSVAD